MALSFRSKLHLFACVTSGLGVVTLAAFFLNLYRSEKYANLAQTERLDIQRSAQALENLISVGETIPLDRIDHARQLILVADQVCEHGGVPQVALSKAYAGQFDVLGLKSTDWSNSLDVFLSCKELADPGHLLGAKAPEFRLIPFSLSLMVPYLAVLARDRLILISMEDFQVRPESTVFLQDSAGKIAWSADSSDFVSQALGAVGLSGTDIATIAAVRDAGPSELATGSKLTEKALLSYAPVGDGAWTLVSIAYLPTIQRTLTYAFSQFLLLSLAILCISLLVGRNLSAVLMKPLEELKASTDRFGAGELQFRFEGLGSDEFSSVKKAFNVMAERVSALIEDSRAKALLESELSLAREVQELLFPPTFVRLPHLQIASHFEFAEHCGGDWWGYFETKDREGRPLTVALIGDVTGHGAPSALLTAAMRGAVSVLTRWVASVPDLATDPARVLDVLNQCICDTGKHSLNMTFFVVVFDPTRQKLYCSNAAHLSAYLFSPPSSGTTEWKTKAIGAANVTLGESLDTRYVNETYDWRPGCKLFFYTDGLVDAVSGGKNIFDRKVLRKILESLVAGQTSQGLIRKVMDRRSQITRGLPKVDDITAVAFECLAEAKEKAA